MCGSPITTYYMYFYYLYSHSIGSLYLCLHQVPGTNLWYCRTTQIDLRSIEWGLEPHCAAGHHQLFLSSMQPGWSPCGEITILMWFSLVASFSGREAREIRTCSSSSSRTAQAHPMWTPLTDLLSLGTRRGQTVTLYVA